MTKPRSGATAMKHAKAILERDFPVTQYSGKSIVHLGNGRMIAHNEDLLEGCFDALAFGPKPPYALAVQVTSQNAKRSTVAPRKRKIEAGFLKWFPSHAFLPLQVEVWSWIDRTGFRVWTWQHADREWREAEELLRSPELKR